MKIEISDDWNWKLRAAFLVIAGHIVILILPFFSVIFLLMDILAHDFDKSMLTGVKDLTVFMEGCILILLIMIFFLEMILMFSPEFSKLIVTELILLIVFIGAGTCFDDKHKQHYDFSPIIIISFCSIAKIIFVIFKEPIQATKKDLMKKINRPGKIV